MLSRINYLSVVVERNLEYLQQENFLKKDKNGYQLNNLGEDYLNSRKFEDIDFNLIDDMKMLFDGLSSDEVCALSYFTFPETTSESVILDRIIKNRKKLALNLYKKIRLVLRKHQKLQESP